MAYVRRTQTLMEDVSNTVISMMHAELSKTKKALSIEIGTPLHDEVRKAVIKAAWHEAPDLVDKLPDSWCKFESSIRVKFDSGDDWNNVRKDLEVADTDKIKLPPTYNKWNDVKLNSATWSPTITSWLAEIHAQEAKDNEVKDMFNGISDQLTSFLGKHASLNTAIKEMPELKLYVPDEYIARLEQKSAPRTQTQTQSVVEDLDIDVDNITRLAVAHRMTKVE